MRFVNKHFEKLDPFGVAKHLQKPTKGGII